MNVTDPVLGIIFRLRHLSWKAIICWGALTKVIGMKNYSLNGLKVFEAAARHLSFTAGANELNVTQAAVSQQIRRLESQLDVQLFDRTSGGLTLTTAGKELADATVVSLFRIDRSIMKITQPRPSGAIIISTLASFSSRWLTPRITSFNALHPTIDLYVHTSPDKIDLSGDGIDGAIRLGAREEDGLHTIPLFQDYLCLVSSPDIAREIGCEVTKLYDHPFVIDGSGPVPGGTTDITGSASEEAILDLGLSKDKLNLVMHFQSDNVVLAALAGKGVALTRFTLCVDDLRTGKLDTILNFRSPLGLGYSFVCPTDRASDPIMITFTQWLLNEFAKTPYLIST